jgi:Multidrug resistance efflux pump
MNAKRKPAIIASSAAAIILLIIIFAVRANRSGESPLFVEVQEGLFEATVVTSGELSVQKSTRIEGPQGLRARNVRFNDVKIQDIIPEGTNVKKGDYVATLDRSAAENSLKDLEDELEVLRAKQERILLDTSLTLRGARNTLMNMKFDLEEKKIAVEQSIYEPPATQRQLKNTLEKAQRDWEQEQQNYRLKVEQAQASVQDGLLELTRKERQYKEMIDVLANFVILAPDDGMVIYMRDWSGEKRRAGSTLNTYDLVVATLPDLSSMISTTQVNEIDISKIKVGNPVRVGVDAFPDKVLEGVVAEIANVGAGRQGSAVKLFEVIVHLKQLGDQDIKPSMTSSNTIVAASVDKALYIPLEAVYSNEEEQWVYKANGSRQVVKTGIANESHCVVEEGLTAGEKIYLSEPKRK